MLLVGVN